MSAGTFLISHTGNATLAYIDIQYTVLRYVTELFSSVTYSHRSKSSYISQKRYAAELFSSVTYSSTQNHPIFHKNGMQQNFFHLSHTLIIKKSHLHSFPISRLPTSQLPTSPSHSSPPPHSHSPTKKNAKNENIYIDIFTHLSDNLCKCLHKAITRFKLNKKQIQIKRGYINETIHG